MFTLLSNDRLPVIGEAVLERSKDVDIPPTERPQSARPRRALRSLVDLTLATLRDVAPFRKSPNRPAFVRRLSRRLRATALAPEPTHLLLVDLEGLRDCNERYGSSVGDRLVRRMGARLRTICGPRDLLARIGGDEFAILPAPATEAETARALAGRVLQAIDPPFEHPDGPLRASLSVGMASGLPGEAADELMSRAEVALRRAKSSGRLSDGAALDIFDALRDAPTASARSLLRDLRSALDRDEFVLEYQPIVAADTLRLCGVEALLRWRHPTRGLLQPHLFIGSAETGGLIAAIGTWVLRRACEDARAWTDLRVAVNVSPAQFRDAAFRDTVVAVLAETRFDPGRLELELTESVVIDDAEEAEVCLIDLRSMGVRLALDDFGTGYSSLLYLRRFAFDKIKIDRSFIESLEAEGESAIIVSSVVALGRALGLTVVAEGVETPAQQAHLQAMGCPELQGYLYAPPGPAAAITAMLAAERATASRAAPVEAAA